MFTSIALTLTLTAGASAPPTGFAERFPDSVRDLGPSGRLTHASGFRAMSHEADPVRAARGFLAEHGAAFGVEPRFGLESFGTPVSPGQVGEVRFRRTLLGLPIFGGEVVVGLDRDGAIFVVNAAEVPANAAVARFRLAEDGALAKARLRLEAIAKVRLAAPPHVEKGYLPKVGALRPAYQVDLEAVEPAGDYRLYVDGETGAVLRAMDRRQYTQGKVYEISPCQNNAGKCTLAGKTYAKCMQPVLEDLGNTTSATSLTGQRTSAYNCKGGEAQSASTASCQQLAAASGGVFDYPPDLSTGSTQDSFAEVSAYYHVDNHVSFLEKLDAQAATIIGFTPGFVNTYQGGAPLDNAFFSPSSKKMVFGQGSGVDFAYDGEVVYHEMTHAAIGPIAGFQESEDQYGWLDDPGAVNEGTADALSVTHDHDSQLGEYDAASTAINLPFVRDLNNQKTCKGDGTVVKFAGQVSTINGLDGEVHDDGEIWGGFYWELLKGLKNIDTTGVCNGSGCEAAALLQFKAIRLAGSTPTFKSYGQNMIAAADALFAAKPEVKSYVQCVFDKHALAACDGRAVPVYSGEKKFIYLRPPFDSIGPVQPTFEAASGTASVKACAYAGYTGTLHVRFGQAVGWNGSSVTSDAQVAVTSDCNTPQRATLSLTQPGTWYTLFEGSGGGYFQVEAGANIAARPGPPNPKTCPPPGCVPSCSGKQCGDDGCGGNCGTCPAPGSCGSDNQCHGSPASDGGTGDGGHSGGGGAGAAPGCGCGGGPVGLVALAPLLALRRRRR
jgi:Zn-dependent metalloprotease